MRFINTKTIQLEEFFGDQIPDYAILSHTWVAPKDEVTFQDMSSGQYEHKLGFTKIQYLCQQASGDHLSWAWCDTCCINKDSSAELSEAINSMFQWYQNAKFCYAYVSDVPSSGPDDNNLGILRSSVSEQFQKSRWFRRGWTLQELLAPKEVIFFAKDWTCIGRKHTLYNIIRTVTGINRGALEWPWTISSYSIATRISWAAKRETSWPEDRAYSLLGILGVHMPLLYGEAQNAFQRLQTELIKISDDETLFAHSGPNILAENPDAFISWNECYELPRSSQQKPYSITNMGLSIEIPLILNRKHPGDYGSRPSSFKCFGILNCHHGHDYKHFLAIPLLETSLEGTFLRAPGPATLINEASARNAEKTAVIIKLRPLQVSKITYLQEFRGLLRRPSNYYENSISVYTSSVPWQFRENRVTLHLNPKAEFAYELAVHEFIGKSDDESFVVVIIFEPFNSNAGLMIYALHEHEALRHQGPNALFSVWEEKGAPSKETLQIKGPHSEMKTIVARIAQESRLNQPVWVLSLEGAGLQEEA